MADTEWITTVDAKQRKSKINIVGKIKDKPAPKEISLKAGGKTMLCNAILTDAKGDIKLDLWGEECNKVNQGDIVRISNGYTNEFQGNTSLRIGKYGKMEIVGQA